MHDPRAVLIVEGESDRAAVLVLAARAGRDLTAERVAVVSMSGFTGIGRALAHHGPQGRGLPLAVLSDAREARFVARALADHGLEGRLFVCTADLEDELIRAAGPELVERVLAGRGELPAFRSFQRQPAQRDRALDAQLRRFIGTRSGRKRAVAEALARAVPAERVPAPLAGMLAAV